MCVIKLMNDKFGNEYDFGDGDAIMFFWPFNTFIDPETPKNVKNAKTLLDYLYANDTSFTRTFMMDLHDSEIFKYVNKQEQPELYKKIIPLRMFADDHHSWRYFMALEVK